MIWSAVDLLRTHLTILTTRFDREEDGVTAIEYGLIAALIAVAIIGALILVGDALVDMFTGIAGNL